jgi:hypothetical protein
MNPGRFEFSRGSGRFQEHTTFSPPIHEAGCRGEQQAGFSLPASHSLHPLGGELSGPRFPFAGSAFLGQADVIGSSGAAWVLAGKLGLKQGEFPAHALAKLLIEKAAFTHGKKHLAVDRP